jgi:ethylbenzene dioxygenase subunit beta
MTIPEATSGYFDLDFYNRMHQTVRSWATMDAIPESMRLSAETEWQCGALLYHEARLIDQGRLDDWLDLFTDNACYWLPADASELNPAKTVSWEFNDRRRMEERVERILTGKAYSQLPPTRTTHSYTNIELMAVSDDEIHALCKFMINTHRPEGNRLLSGWNGFILKRQGASWLIDLKRVNLIDADAPQGNLSFFL